MKNTARFRRTAAAAGLASTAALTAVSTVLAPPFPGEFEALLAGIDAAGTSATVSALTFTLAQLPLLAAVLGIGHLLRPAAPTLSNLGTTLAVIGTFGHAVHGGVSMVQLSMAADESNRAVHADILTAVESGPAVAFMAMGLLGTVLGLLLLAIGLWRARVQPRWVGPVLGAFLVVEFVGGGLTEWSTHVAVVLYLLAFGALAATVRRSSDELWQTAGEAPVTVARIEQPAD